MNDRAAWANRLAWVLAAGWLCAPAVGADDAQAVFDELYGAEHRRVLATRETADDVALAAKLLEAAEKSKDQPALLVVLCEKVWELSVRDAAALPALTKSAQLLAAAAPQEMDARKDKLLEHLQRLYAASRPDDRPATGTALIAALEERSAAAEKAGELAAAADLTRRSLAVASAIRSDQKDRLQERLAGLVARQKTMAEVNRLRAALVLNPADKAARQQLISLYVVDLDDPAAAVPHLTADVPETWRTYVPLAMKDPASLDESVCLELAGWYEQHAAQSASARVAMLLRARQYYQEYLRKHPPGDLAAKKAELALKDLEDRLAKLVPGLAPAVADPEIRKAIEKASQFLWSAQRDDGSWNSSEDRWLDRTALPALGLLEGGVGAKDPRMAKALKWLGDRQPQWTFEAAMRLRVWAAASRSSPGAFKDAIQADLSAVQKAWSRGRFLNRIGGGMMRMDSHTSNCYGLLGIEAGGGAASGEFWQQALSYWSSRQQEDGGWAPQQGPSSPTATAEGAACLVICLRRLGMTREEAARTAPVVKALGWLEKNHPSEVGKPEGELSYGYLAALTRLGEATGSRKLGKLDWFTSAADVLKKAQRPNGSWPGDNPSWNTARALLFLAAGSRLPAS